MASRTVNRLCVLGSLGLGGPRFEQGDLVLRQPKRLSLLVYLSLARPRGFHSRDKLLGLFWPEMDEPHARNALSKSLQFLRATLGAEAIRTRGQNEVAVNGELVWLDAVALEEGIAAGDLPASLELYRGPLLDGVFVRDTPGVERWIEDERFRITGLVTESGWSLAQSFLASGEKAEAARWAKWTASLQPADEASMQRALRLLQAAGDRSGGLEAYDRLRRHLSEQGEPPPGEETVRLARELASSESSDTGPLTPPKRSSVESAVATFPDSAARSQTHTSRLHRALRRTPWVVVVLAVTGFVTWTAWFRPPPRLDPDLMVVVPFRVAGAHPSLAYLREGMIDLLAMGLTGEGGLRIVDPRSTLAAWRQLVRSDADAPTPKTTELARRLGAGQVLLGEVVGSASRVVVTLSVLRVPGGEVRTLRSIEASPDSLAELAHRVSTELLLAHSGQSPSERVALTRAPPASLRAYLAGKAAYRRGSLDEAAGHFLRALEGDSTFAAAGIAFIQIAGRQGHARAPWVRDRTWNERDRLSPMDRAYLTAQLGPRYPTPSPSIERLASFEAAATTGADRPEPWFELGEFLMRFGPYLGIDSARRRASIAFDHSLKLDSSYALPLVDLVRLAGASEDKAAVKRLGTLYLERNPTGEYADYVRWRMAVALENSAARKDLRAKFSTFSSVSLKEIVWTSQLDGVALEDGEASLAVLEGRPADRRWGVVSHYDFALNRGRPQEALSLVEEAWTDEVSRQSERIQAALFWDGDSAAGEEAARVLALTAAAASATFAGNREAQVRSACFVGLWHLNRRDTADIWRTIHDLRTVPESQGIGLSQAAAGCADLLDAQMEGGWGGPAAAASAKHLDALMRRGPGVSMRGSIVFGNLLAARLLEGAGDLAAARAATQRRWYWGRVLFLSTFLLEEARLSEQIGDRAAAIRAYRHYLTLRANPEPALRAQLDQARAELDGLTARSIAADRRP